MGAPITIAGPVWRIVLGWAPVLPVPVIVIGTVGMSCVFARVYVPAASWTVGLAPARPALANAIASRSVTQVNEPPD